MQYIKITDLSEKIVRSIFTAIGIKTNTQSYSLFGSPDMLFPSFINSGLLCHRQRNTFCPERCRTKTNLKLPRDLTMSPSFFPQQSSPIPR